MKSKKVRLCKCGEVVRKYFHKGVFKNYQKTCGNKECDNIGQLNNKWKGGKTIDKDGYVLILDRSHESIKKKGISRYRREHIVVMENYLKRNLKKGEVVHHKNGIKSDNRLENLQLFKSNGEHLKFELTGKNYAFRKRNL